MKLGVFERMLLGNILPPKGNALTMGIVEELGATLSFSEAEHAALRIKQDPDSTFVQWNKEADKPTEIEIGPVAFGVIRDRFVFLDAEGELTLEHMPLYRRFVKDQEPTPEEAK